MKAANRYDTTRPPAAGDRVAVIGAGRSGLAALKLLCCTGVHVRLLEKDETKLSEEARAFTARHGVEVVFGEHKAAHFEDADFVVISPGIPAARVLPLFPNPRAGRAKLLAETELAWRLLRGESVLAVTGTSGKTTTASLAAAMLRRQGLNVFLGGNIGTPLSEYVLDGEKADVLVLEVSSFQLQCCSTFHPNIAVLLNISENHLDYHADMHEYIEAKFRLFRRQDENDLAVLGKELEPLAARMPIKARRLYYTPCNRFPDSPLFGAHNQADMEAAYQACRPFGVTEEKAAEAAAAFTPLPHRLERVRETGDVLYVNDSKCTTVKALKAALEAFDRPLLLLAGGKFKGGDLAGLNELLRARARCVELFGACREQYENAWRGAIPLHWSPTMEEAVIRAKEQARPGDVVLLSPASASFDLYADYEARGNDFKRIVSGLYAEGLPS
jgi:UDP-N-acetylmuramoylalanine--D-glutamate ligase